MINKYCNLFVRTSQNANNEEARVASASYSATWLLDFSSHNMIFIIKLAYCIWIYQASWLLESALHLYVDFQVLSIEISRRVWQQQPSYCIIGIGILCEGLVEMTKAVSRASIDLWQMSQMKELVHDGKMRDEHQKWNKGFSVEMECMSGRKESSCTPCSHIFCWRFILHWTLYFQEEYTLCCEACKAQNILSLYIYLPTT